MNLKNTAILCMIVALLSAAGTRYYFPQVQTKTVEVTKEVSKDVVRDHVVTVIKTVKQPNGEVDTTQTVVDNTVHTDTDVKTDSKTTISIAPKNWLVSATVNSNLQSFLTPTYGLQAQRRILGPVFVGVNADNHGDLGISVGLEF